MAVKLVRDAIREVPGFQNFGSYREVRDHYEHEALLLKKIAEELGELLEAHTIKNSHEVNEEGCDLLEAVTAFLWIRTGITPDQIARQIGQKQLSKGGLLGGLVWEHP